MIKILLSTFKILLSIAIIWFLLSKVDLKSTIELLLNAHKGYSIAALGVILIQVVVISFRWKNVLFHLNILDSFEEILRITWIGLFFNQVLPSSIGGDAFRTYYLHKKGHSLVSSMLGVLIDRVFGVIALVILVIVTFWFLITIVNEPITRWGLYIIAGSSVLAICALLSMDLFTKSMLNWKFIRGVRSISYESRRLVLSFSPGIKLIVLSLLNHILTIISILFLSVGIGLDAHWFGIIIIMPIASLIMMVPVSIAGWGIREGVLIIGLGYLGIGPESALALSLLYGILMLIISLPGFLIWLMSNHPYMHQVK